MNGAKQFGLGIKTYGQAISFIFRNKMGWTFLVPVGLTILLIILDIYLVKGISQSLEETLTSWIGIEGESIWGGIIGFVLGLVLSIMSYFIFFYVAGFIIIILMSPILAYLSEKTEKILTGKEYKVTFAETIQDIIRGISIAVRNLILELLCLFLLLIPVIGWILVFIITAYFYGFSFIDLNNERQRLSVKESIKVIRKYKWLAIGNGVMFSLFLLVPFCKFFMPFFASIVAVVAAALAMHQTDAYKNKQIQ